MLVEFRVENHRSIREEQVFTMEAGRVGTAEDPRPRQVDGYRQALLPVAALYGANASGKSNLLDALGYMQIAILHSHRVWDPEGGVPRSPFSWDGFRKQASTFELTFLVDSIRYEYGFVIDDTHILEEWLYAWPKGSKSVWFERESDGDSYAYKFGDGLKGDKRLIEEVTRPNALFLSVAAQHNNAQLTKIYEWFWDLRTINLKSKKNLILHPTGDRWLAAAFRPHDSTTEEVHPNQARIETLLQLVKAADIGILNMRADPSDPSKLLVQHRSSPEDAWLPFSEESDGTKVLLWRAPLLIDALQSGGVVIVDELEASLHPLLALRLVELFNDPMANSKNAQLIFSTHDTNLLNGISSEAPLRRDQIWLTEKSMDGATEIFPLTDYKPRKSENLERGYLMGRYGAIPFLGALDSSLLASKP
ncbi:MAG: ATP-binding protein [Cyanobacteria bacterium]|nr:ATP-binding protein [Cyanobacteriota bacterium]